MNLCKNNHDKDVVGTVIRSRGTANPARVCCECIREQRARDAARKRAIRKANRPAPRPKQSREERLARRRRKEAQKRQEEGRRAYNKRTDGWEDEFGPVPPEAPVRTWVDEVVVLRMLTGEKTGRLPTPAEWDEFFARNNGRVSLERVSESSGASPLTVASHARRCGYRFLAHRTPAMAGSPR